MATTTGTVQFIQFHQPSLESGEYKITVEQSISDANNKIPAQTFTRERTFAVLGERFGPLAPEEIYGVFPPRDSLGEHSNVLPHITIKRSTLPWERYPRQEDENLSWLALLLFRESDFETVSDKPKPKNITLGELVAGDSTVKFPQIDLELGQTDSQSVTVIDVKNKYIKDILPSKDDLAYLGHVRRADDGETEEDVLEADEEFPEESIEEEDEEFATLICNRLPQPNGTSTVHLVSLEGRYSDTGFDDMGAGDEDLIRFVSLANWSFTCVDPEQSFSRLIEKLNRTPSSLRLPEHADAQVETWFGQGYLPMPHVLREGSQTVSWYRSPLIPGQSSETSDAIVKTSDELLRYDPTLGLFDASYAAAWQLGRTLMLQNQGLAIKLYNWKRENAHLLKEGQQRLNLPLRSHRYKQRRKAKKNDVLKQIPLGVLGWFLQIERLKNIPFNYLVPDERLLPIESMRFFWVDPFWVECLQDGAFSVGRVTDIDIEEDRTLRTKRSLRRTAGKPITGVLIRSQVISGWPNLRVAGYDEAIDDLGVIEPNEARRLPRLRMEKLAEDVLICLFLGEVKTVDIYLKAEGMNFGLDPRDNSEAPWTKNLRNAEGEPTETVVTPIPWHHEAKGVIDLDEFASAMNKQLGISNFTSGQFALQLIEGAQRIRFITSADGQQAMRSQGSC